MLLCNTKVISQKNPTKTRPYEFVIGFPKGYLAGVYAALNAVREWYNRENKISDGFQTSRYCFYNTEEIKSIKNPSFEKIFRNWHGK